MNLQELIMYLRNDLNIEKLIAKELPNVEMELVDIYLKDELGLESEI